MKSLSFLANGISTREIESHLDEAIALNNPHKSALLIENLVRKYGIRCIEIDAYIEEYRPVFMAALAVEIEKSEVLFTAKGRKRNQIFHTLKLKAVNSLDIHPENFTHDLFPIEDDGKQDPRIIADFIFWTYFRIKSAATEKKQFLSPHLTNVRGFKLFNSERCCPSCQRAAEKLYQRGNLPDLPFHIGCGCWLSPVFTWE